MLRPMLREGDRWAALDLGSNNFQMLVVEIRSGELRVIDRLKDKVQLLQGFSKGCLSVQAIARGLGILGKYRQLIASVPVERVIARGTHALRVADNRLEFMEQAEQILGVPILVVSGEEEARLIDVAVSRHLDSSLTAGDAQPSLVIDIGGGSTEFALSSVHMGQRRLSASASLPLGCVSLTEAWFSRPDLVGATYTKARDAALEVCTPELKAFAGAPFVIGTSGILESILTVAEANGFSHGAVTRLALLEIERALTSGLWVADLGLPGLPPERADIFPAGVAILSAVMQTLRIERVHFSSATLPLGILYDALELGADATPKAHAVASLASTLNLDARQGQRVRNLALALFDCVHPAPGAGERALLGYAADLHEAGLAIDLRSHNRHGAYILQHASLRGFDPDDQQALAWLVRGQRGTFPHGADSIAERLRIPDLRDMLIALRLAVILERARSDAAGANVVSLAIADREVRLQLSADWLAGNSLTASGLMDEAVLLARQGLRLCVIEA